MSAMIFNGKTWESFGGMDKLWTNPNPGSNFAAQTVTLNLTDYKGILAELKFNTTAETVVTVISAKNQMDTAAFHFANATPTSSGAVSLVRRLLSCTDAGVIISAANIKPMTATAGSTNNSYLIPLTIWGVK